MTRRRLLQGLLVLAATLGFVAVWRMRRLGELAARWLEPRIDPAGPRGRPSDAEIETLLAFAEVVVEGRPLSKEGRQAMVEHVVSRTQEAGGYLALYRMTAALCDELARARFSGLSFADRARLVEQGILTRDAADPGLSGLLWRRRERAVRTLVVPDLASGYYASAAGWGVVGYDFFPGRCSDLVQYTRPGPEPVDAG